MSYPTNRLPTLNTSKTGAWRAHRPRPSAHALEMFRPVAPPDELIEAMGETLFAGLAEIQGIDPSPANLLYLDDPRMREIFQPAPGRCLWNWWDLMRTDQVQDDPDILDLAPIVNLALRPSEALDETRIGSLTPRFAMHLANLRPFELVKAARWMNDQGLLPARLSEKDVRVWLYPQGYGQPFDGDLDTMALASSDPNDWKPPRNSRRSLAQQYILDREGVSEEDSSSDTPSFPQQLLDHPPFEVDLGPTLHQAFLDACEHLRAVAIRAKAQEDNPKDSPYFRDIWDKVQTWDLTRLEVEAIPLYLNGPWDLPRLHSEALSPQQHLTRALVRSMARRLYRYGARFYSQPYTVLAVSLLTGISPAIFVRSAMERFRQTGLTFLNESHVVTLVEAIRELPQPRGPGAQADRSELIDELNGLTQAYMRLSDRMDWAVVDEADQLLHSNDFPAWGVGGLDLLD